MNFPIHTLRIMFSAVQTAQAGWVGAAIRSRIPLRQAEILKPATKLCAYGSSPVISKAFTHCACFFAPAEGRYLVVLNRMTILVQNHFGIFGVINSAKSISDLLRQ